MSSFDRPASASAPMATSACRRATERCSARRVGCSYAPTMQARPFRLMVRSCSLFGLEAAGLDDRAPIGEVLALQHIHLVRRQELRRQGEFLELLTHFR